MAQQRDDSSPRGEEKILDGFRRLGACRDVTSALEVAADLAWEGTAPSWVVLTATRPDGSPMEAVRGVDPENCLVAAVRSLDPIPSEGMQVSRSDLSPDSSAGAAEPPAGTALLFPLDVADGVRGALAVGFGNEGDPGGGDRGYLSFLRGQVDLVARRLSGAESFLRDSLTGLRSHVGFLLRLLDEWSICQAKGSPVSLILIEVCGAGESVGGPDGDRGGKGLRRAAALLREETGEVDLLARRGPRSLEILLPQVGSDWAHRIARRIARRIKGETVPPAGGEVASLDCAVGVATAPEDAASPEELLARVEARVRSDEVAQEAQVSVLPGEDPGKALLGMLSRVLQAGWDLDSLLDILVGMLVEILGAERGFVLLKDLDGSPIVRSARGRGNLEVESPEREVSWGITNKVMKTGRPILIHDAGTHPLFADSESVAGLGLRAVLCVPIQKGSHTFGCLYLEHRSDPGRFTPVDQEMLVEFARRVSQHLHHSMEFRRKSMELEKASQRLEGYRAAPDEGGERYGIVGRSPGLMQAMGLLQKAIGSDLPVHVTGESGTGKELVARAIHFEGPRDRGPFVTENCAAIPESIFERELFGHVRGVFTGANADKPGLIESAAGGTLFLDEIGELSLGMQAKILRVIEEKGIRRLGGQEWIHVDFRLVTASNRSLETLVSEGRFREDLYYRLEGFTVPLPPLRERKEDIPLLVEHFLKREGECGAGRMHRVHREVLLTLLRYDWPGNVRELENILRRACAVGGEEIQVEDLPRRLKEKTTRKRYLPGLWPARPEPEDGDRLLGAIEQAGGNKTEAARRLGISKSTLYARLRRLREREEGKGAG